MSKPMTPERRAELRRLCNEALEGPWYPKHGGLNLMVQHPKGGDISVFVATCISHEQRIANVAFAATARTALPELLDEVERLRRFDGCDGCSTGDCPHDDEADCVQAQGAALAAAAAENERLREALKEYADEDSWHDFEPMYGAGVKKNMFEAHGYQRASEALGDVGAEGKP